MGEGERVGAVWVGAVGAECATCATCATCAACAVLLSSHPHSLISLLSAMTVEESPVSSMEHPESDPAAGDSRTSAEPVSTATEPISASEENDSPTQEIIPDRIFVGNLPYEVTEEQVRNLTPEFDVVSVEIPRKNYYNQHLNRYVLQSKGYGFITYVNADDARQAIASIVGKFIAGREIYAKYALPQNKSKFQIHNQQQHQQHQQHHQQQQHQQHQQQSQQHQSQLHSQNNSQQYNHNHNHPQPYPFHIRNGYTLPPGPPGANFYPAFIPVPMTQHSNGSGSGHGNPGSGSSSESGSVGPNTGPFYYTEVPAAPVLNLPPIKFNDPNSVAPFYPQKLELPNMGRLNRDERRRRLENGKPSKLTVFIGNLDRNVTHFEMEQYLLSKGFNKPKRIKIPKKNLQPEIYQVLKLNRVKIQNKGIGFVKFETHDEQIKAIELCNGDIWNGKKLNVTVAINVEDEEDDEDEVGEEDEDEEEEEIVDTDTDADDVEVVVSE